MRCYPMVMNYESNIYSFLSAYIHISTLATSEPLFSCTSPIIGFALVCFSALSVTLLNIANGAQQTISKNEMCYLLNTSSWESAHNWLEILSPWAYGQGVQQVGLVSVEAEGSVNNCKQRVSIMSYMKISNICCRREIRTNAINCNRTIVSTLWNFQLKLYVFQ